MKEVRQLIFSTEKLLASARKSEEKINQMKKSVAVIEVAEIKDDTLLKNIISTNDLKKLKSEATEIEDEKKALDVSSKEVMKDMVLLLDKLIIDLLVIITKGLFILILLALALVLLLFSNFLDVIPILLFGLVFGAFVGYLIGFLRSLSKVAYLFVKVKGLKKSVYTDDIIFPPGTNASRIIGFIFPKKIKERVFNPIIADMQSEYFEALDNQLSWKARWIHYRGVFTVVLVAITQLPIFLVDIIIKIKKIG